ncbi:hypothetical protein HMPREF9996_01408 [Aggregatibacter actinomycetemcomitans Y4]|nr:hypothetical protein HMPREF9996_01408 [Aggregatibacter actinomycetemcomitans Y4]
MCASLLLSGKISISKTQKVRSVFDVFLRQECRITRKNLGGDENRLN